MPKSWICDQPHWHRRHVLAGMAALGAGALLPEARAEEKAFRIDVHHHMVPPKYIAEVARPRPTKPPQRPLQPPLQHWSPAVSIEDMDRAGVATAIVSITTPGVWFGDDDESTHIARLSNDYGAKLIADHPGRFGLFAALPMHDTYHTLKEIEYALDILKVEGIGMFTSYDEKYLGHPDFAPIFEELNRRKALVYVHPIANHCCVNLVQDVNEAVIEYGTDTTRTIADFVFSGAAHRYPDVRMIFSHAGGTMPFLIERFVNLAKNPKFADRLPDGVLPVLKRFYYDTAQSANPAAMGALRELVPAGQIVFGTDFPFRTLEEHVEGLRHCGFSGNDLQAIERDNALALLPHLKA
jgi:6-methylsalicylate decarboxylase